MGHYVNFKMFAHTKPKITTLASPNRSSSLPTSIAMSVCLCPFFSVTNTKLDTLIHVEGLQVPLKIALSLIGAER